MTGNNRKKKRKKSKQPLARIGSLLFPRAMLVAVPRSPEPPKECPEDRPPSAVSSALMNATLVGRLIGTPPPSTGTMGTDRSPSPPNYDEAGPADKSLENSMGHTSMYDYGDSEESSDDDEESEVEAIVHEEPRYASVPLRGRGKPKRETISDRPRMASPRESDIDSQDSNLEEEPVQDISPGRMSSRVEHDNTPSPAGPADTHRSTSRVSAADTHRSTSRVSAAGYEVPFNPNPTVVTEELQVQGNSQASTDSDFTEVTNTADDFSDLITPPPPWKRKPPGTDVQKEVKKTPREKKSKKKQKRKAVPVQEEIIVPSHFEREEVIDQSSPSYLQSAPPALLRNVPSFDDDFYNHIDRLVSAKSLQEHEFLRMTNTHLEKELGVVQKEREQLVDMLKMQGQQMREDRYSSRPNSPVQTESNSRANLQISELCGQLRSENSSIRIANDRLLEENRTLRESLKTPRELNEDEGEGVFIEQLKKQAEEVLIENEDLRNIIHKLNIQMSRYQAKCSPLKKSDPPGLPSRGASPKWLTDTKYLSPLVVAYEDALGEKEDVLQQCQHDLDELKASAEKVVKENQRLHHKLEDMQGTGNSYITPSEWHRLQEQARLVLEENQVVLEQLDINQDKLKSSKENYTLEFAKLNGRLAAVEAEKTRMEEEVGKLKSQNDALQDKYEKLMRESNQKLPLNQHLDAITDMQRSLDGSQRQHYTEMENLTTRLKSIQTEKQDLAIQLTDQKAESTQLDIQVKALQKAQKKGQQKVLLLHQDVEAALSGEQQANLHLNQVLEIAEKTAAERDAFAKMAKAQAQEKEKTVNKMMQGNIYVGKMEEKLKLYKLRAQEKLESMSQEMLNQDSNFSGQVRQYEREIRHLQQIVKEKQVELDRMIKDKRKAEEQLETVWKSATSDNQRIQAKLSKSLRPSTLIGQENGAFGSDSDNKGLLSSDSES